MSQSGILSITADIQIVLAGIYIIALAILWPTKIRRFCFHGIFLSLVLAISPRFVRTESQGPEILPPALRFFDPLEWVLALLALDLAIVTYVIFKTGGSHRSPFSHLYFVLPVLALLLGLRDTAVYSYAGLVLLAFTGTIATGKGLAYLDEPRKEWTNAEDATKPQFTYERILLRIAFWAISVIAFGLALWVHTRRA